MDPRFSESGVTFYTSPIAGEAAAATLKSGAGKLFALRVSNLQGTVRYAHVYDNTAASGTPLIPPLVLPANSERELYLRFVVPFATGLTIASSTSQTSVAGGGTDLQISAIFK